MGVCCCSACRDGAWAAIIWGGGRWKLPVSDIVDGLGGTGSRSGRGGTAVEGDSGAT